MVFQSLTHKPENAHGFCAVSNGVRGDGFPLDEIDEM